MLLSDVDRYFLKEIDAFLFCHKNLLKVAVSKICQTQHTSHWVFSNLRFRVNLNQTKDGLFKQRCSDYKHCDQISMKTIPV